MNEPNILFAIDEGVPFIGDEAHSHNLLQKGRRASASLEHAMFRCLVLLLILGISGQGEQHEFGGSFQELRPQQQQLVIKIVRRFNTSTGQFTLQNKPTIALEFLCARPLKPLRKR